MIVFDLACTGGHRFEGWFTDADAFADQRDSGAIPCPYCSVTDVERVLSVPRIGSSGGADPAEALKALATMQAEMLKKSTWVGDRFAQQARAMADGEQPHATIHGQTTIAEARELADDGIAVLPLPFPVVPPESRN